LGGLRGSRVRRIVMKPLLNIFRQFSEVELRNTYFCPHDDSVRLYLCDGRVLVLFAVVRFEVVGQCD